MTIAKRLAILLGVPLVALMALGVFTRTQLAKIESQSRFVAETRIDALATLGNLTRSFSELRIHVRSYLLATSDTQRQAARSAFDTDEQEALRLLRHYADELVMDDQGRRRATEFQTIGREWIDGARNAMGLQDAGRSAEARALLAGPVNGMGEQLASLSKEWIQANYDAASQAGQSAVKEIKAARWKMLVGNGSALLLTALLGYLTFRRIVHPIRSLEATVKPSPPVNITVPSRSSAPRTRPADWLGPLTL